MSSTKPDPLMQSKVKAFSSLFNTPALKSERLPAKSTSAANHTLKAFGGKTVAQLLEEGSDGEDAGAATETKLKSDEDLLTLDQLLKENKKKKAARDDRASRASAILKPSQAPIVSRKRKAPDSPIDLSDDELPAVAQLKLRPKPNILDCLQSDGEDEIDELADDEALGDPITAVQPPAPTKRMLAPRKTSRVTAVSGSSTTLVIADSSDSEVDEVDLPLKPVVAEFADKLFRSSEPDEPMEVYEALNSAEDHEAEVMDMEVDREASEEAHERVEPSFEDAEEDDFEEWLQSSVTVRAA